MWAVLHLLATLLHASRLKKNTYWFFVDCKCFFILALPSGVVATVSEKYISKSPYNLFQTWIEPLVTVNLFGATVTKYAKCFFGREDYDDIPEEVKDEELALEMLTMEAFELCKSGEENCVTLEDIENCKVILIHQSRQLY